jgi:hypothetical protein
VAAVAAVQAGRGRRVLRSRQAFALRHVRYRSEDAYRGSELDAVRVAPALRVEHPFSIPSAGLDESPCLDDERPDAVGNVTPVATPIPAGADAPARSEAVITERTVEREGGLVGRKMPSTTAWSRSRSSSLDTRCGV